MKTEIISAGFGGQGVLLLGQLITYAGMLEDKHVSWLPSYGPEMRGGTTNCHVIVSSDPVGSPVVTEADVVIVLNRPSLDKFEKILKPGGKLFVNNSLVDKKPRRKDIDVHYVPASDIATKLGNVKIANMVMLGAFVSVCKTVLKDNVMCALKEFFGSRKAHLIPLNLKAFNKGAAIALKAAPAMA